MVEDIIGEIKRRKEQDGVQSIELTDPDGFYEYRIDMDDEAYYLVPKAGGTPLSFRSADLATVNRVFSVSKVFHAVPLTVDELKEHSKLNVIFEMYGRHAAENEKIKKARLDDPEGFKKYLKLKERFFVTGERSLPIAQSVEMYGDSLKIVNRRRIIENWSASELVNDQRIIDLVQEFEEGLVVEGSFENDRDTWRKDPISVEVISDPEKKLFVYDSKKKLITINAAVINNLVDGPEVIKKQMEMIPEEFRMEYWGILYGYYIRIINSWGDLNDEEEKSAWEKLRFIAWNDLMRIHEEEMNDHIGKRIESFNMQFKAEA